MALFGGKPKGFDTGALLALLNQGATNQKQLVEGANLL